MIKKIATGFVAIALMFTFTACEEVSGSEPQKQGQKQTEQAFEQQSKAVPYPVTELRDSLERRNLRERLLRTNNPDAIGYVYILSFGKFIGYYTIKGKVSSNQSQMTTDMLLVDSGGCQGCGDIQVTAPGDDGSYGENEEGVFFFTTEGALVQTSSEYLYSDQPINVGSIPELG